MKLARIICSSILLFVALLAVFQPVAAHAQPTSGVPVAPEDLSATAASPTQVKLTWADSSDNETGFRIQRASDRDFTAGVTSFTVGANIKTYNDATVLANTTYFYRVVAFNSAGDSPASNVASVSTQLLSISNKFPTVEVTSGEKAVFQLELKYSGEITGEPKIFDLKVSGPKDWQFYITPQYPTDKKISSIQLLPGFSAGEQIQVNATPAYFLRPEPGNYKITLEASSQDGKITTKTELVTKITAQYNLFVTPASEQYNTTATAGKENAFSIKVINGGSAPVRQISFSADKPEQWLVTFEPQKLDSIASADTQTVDVKITPPARTIAGDYLITLKTSGTEASAEKLELRVTVETPTVWGWVGIAIVVVVIVGLVLTFRQLSRR